MTRHFCVNYVKRLPFILMSHQCAALKCTAIPLSCSRVLPYLRTAVQEKVARYEAVQPMAGWRDLRDRLADDRRLFAFFHPALPGEPLVRCCTAAVLLYCCSAMVRCCTAAVMPHCNGAMVVMVDVPLYHMCGDDRWGCSAQPRLFCLLFS